MTAVATRTGPYGTAALLYTAAGWRGVLPLPRMRKKKPPVGYSGDDNDSWPSPAQVLAWVSAQADGNIALRLPDGVLGIDVDQYGDKVGGDHLAELEEALGPLPSTWTSTSRSAPSGIRLYRVPPGLRFHKEAAPGLEVVQRHHRYALVWPSRHPENRPYLWVTPDGESADRLPTVDELPHLPPAWVDYLRDDVERPAAADNGHALEHRERDRSAAVDRALEKALGKLRGGGSRHDGACAGAAGLARLESSGHPGSTTAIEELGAAFRAAVTRDGAGQRSDREATKEWEDIVRSGRRLARATAATRKPYDDLVGADLSWADRAAAASPISPKSADEGAGDDVDTWAPIDLGPTVDGLVDGTLTRPVPTIGRRDDGIGLFYASRLNGLYASSGEGKSWVAYVVIGQELDTGHVAWLIDFEDDEVGAVSRLLDLGVDPDAIKARFRYVRPDVRLTIDTQQRLGCQLAAERPPLVVIDSTGEFMALEGVEDKDDAVARWVKVYVKPLTAHGSAVVVIDHMPHQAGGRLAPIGSQRKKASLTGTGFMVAAVAELGLGRIGKIRLTTAKDRCGHYVRGKPAAELLIDATTRPYRVELTPPRATDDASDGLDGEPPAIRRIWAVLSALDHPATNVEIGDLIAGDGTLGTGLKRRTLQDGLKRLETLGRAHSPGCSATGGLLWLPGPHPATIEEGESAVDLHA